MWTIGEDSPTTGVERGAALVAALSIVAGTGAASSAKRERLTFGSSGTEALLFEAELARACALAEGLEELDLISEMPPIPAWRDFFTACSSKYHLGMPRKPSFRKV